MIADRRRGLAFLSAILLVSAAVAYPGKASNEKIFDRAWSLTGRHYWDRTMHHLDWDAVHDRYLPRAIAASDTQHLYAVIDEMLDLLGDSHVYATSPERIAYARRQKGGDTTAGFGFDAVEAEGAGIVQTVQKDGPAAAAGMEIGWKLLSIDGRPIDIDRHFGEGDSATISLEDENGVRHDMILKGVRLPEQSDRRASRLAGNILLLGFDQFDKGDDRWVTQQLSTGPMPSGVILDLRDNGGGDANVLDRIAGQFVPDRRVILRLISDRTIEERTSGAGPRSYGGPLAVLVGPRTASAAEVLAAFIEETGRGTTLGERTAGAATGGVKFRLPDGGQLSVAEYDLQTATGSRLEGQGFMPRFPVKPSLVQMRAGDDPVLQRAIALVAGRGTAHGM